MALNFNLANTIASTERDSVFFKPGENTTTRIRFMPPTLPDGSLFYRTATHFNMKQDDNSIALGCLRVHGKGNEECPLCKLSWFLEDNGDKSEKDVAGKIRASNNWYAPVSIATKQADGTLEYGKVVLMRFAKTGTDAIIDLLKGQQTMDQPFLMDPVEGQDVLFTRTGSGKGTKYSAMLTNDVKALDDIMPGWEDKTIKDIPKTVDTKVWDPQDMINSAILAFPKEVDWDRVEKELFTDAPE